MRVLALSPFHGGSHASFLNGWIEHSRHEFVVQSLPAYKWKWRMRHGAITLAEQANAISNPASIDVAFCTDMLNLAEFMGLVHEPLRSIPTVVYFHENQLTYPVRSVDERDLHFAFSNLTTALAASEVWFNSAFHRDEYLGAIPNWLKRMPDFQPLHATEVVRNKSRILSPGVNSFSLRSRRKEKPLHIVWASRWEHDKGPDEFFAAIDRLVDRGCDFRLSVLGESYREVPDCFAAAKLRHRQRILHWGYQDSRESYHDILRQADVIVSTAWHEFFGIAVVEAVAAGCFPLVPRRLAYPEVLAGSQPHDFFYDGTVADLVQRLTELAAAPQNMWSGDPTAGQRLMQRYTWTEIVPQLDSALASLA